jgi:hypothetical protein
VAAFFDLSSGPGSRYSRFLRLVFGSAPTAPRVADLVGKALMVEVVTVDKARNENPLPEDEENTRAHLSAPVDETGGSATARAMRRGTKVETGTRPSTPSKQRTEQDEHEPPTRSRVPRTVKLGTGHRLYRPTRGDVLHWYEGAADDRVLHHGRLRAWGATGALLVNHEGEFEVPWTDVQGTGHHPSVAAEVERKAAEMRARRDKALADVMHNDYTAAFLDGLSPEHRLAFMSLDRDEQRAIAKMAWSERPCRAVQADDDKGKRNDFGEELDLLDDSSDGSIDR